ncbi:hypothetical protein Zm00014a_030340 [Zea mays]|uniref:Uncharacterized protein n=1 Tax=Zea mays TaxID=4577 RepID=A0A317YJJ0_MAIZE|nr:hypothetical protein Zm00014a_030340 [Zea mays]
MTCKNTKMVIITLLPLSFSRDNRNK